MNQTATPPLAIRPLTRDDLAAVIAIDRSIEGRSRRTYVERRLAAALREPELHVQFGACDDEGLCGYVLARVLGGEFGRSSAALRLELVGLRQDLQRSGTGTQLFAALTQWAGRHGMAEFRTSAEWTNGPMLGWLRANGFRLAADVVLEMDARLQGEADDVDVRPTDRETNYGATEANDHERLTRDGLEIRPMMPADLPEILRIDRAVTGRDRGDHIRSMLAEAMEASRTRVSLVGRLDRAIVGFVMARADIGDYGRTEPVAIVDTIGVDPAYGRRGIGQQLVARLAGNAAQLEVERIETVVRWSDAGMLAFFQSAGFAPSQRLAFVRPAAG